MSNSNGHMNGGVAKLRNVRPMPQWVSEQKSSIGPKPPAPPPVSKEMPPSIPPKKMQPDPDYEVIEFSGQQYSNASTIKSTSGKRADGMKCDLCGSLSPRVKCEQCNQLFCGSCDDMFHRHPKRKSHTRKILDIPQHVRPPLPPKGEPCNLPVPPPRRNKRSILVGSFLGGKDQQVSAQRPEPPPSPSLSVRERMGSLRRIISPNNRPLPETPTSMSGLPPPRPETPGRENPFDLIQKPQSLAMERIKTQTSATLDRMSILQQRYRQHQELMKTGSDQSRRTSIDSQNDALSSNRNRFSDSSPDPWANPSLNRLRSGSMASGMNSLNRQDNRFENNVQRTVPIPSGNRTFGGSVFELNQIGHRAHQYPTGFHQDHVALNQAPSCLNCSQQQLNWNQQMPPMGWDAPMCNLNGSNMSLNLPPPGYYPGQTWQRWAPPPMYPYPVGMIPVVDQGLIPGNPRNRAPSRSQSRAASPAMSQKSRKSTMSSRNMSRSNYMEHELTDDEETDSDGYLDDFRSARGRREGSIRASSRRGRLNSVHSNIDNMDDDSETLSRSSRHRSAARSTRERRGNSNTRSIQGWNGTKPSNAPSDRLSDRMERLPVSSKKTNDTPLTPDSESESGTRALVQAKIREKLAQQSSLDESSSDFWKTPLKKSVAHMVNDESRRISNFDVPISQIEEPKVDIKNSVSQPMVENSIIMTERPKDVVLENSDIQQNEINTLDDGPTGPPPSTPDEEWECQFCTFINEPNVKICSICCKTQVKMNKNSTNTVDSVDSMESLEPVSVIAQPEPIEEAAKDTPIPAENSIVSPVKPSETIKKNSSSSTLNSSTKLKSSSSSDGLGKEANGKTKESGTDDNHWMQDSLEESVQEQTVSDVKSDVVSLPVNSQRTNGLQKCEKKMTDHVKVSTGCGPSPPKDVKKSLAKKVTTSTGTSPPPQSASTQTYESVVVHRDDNERLPLLQFDQHRSYANNIGVQTYNNQIPSHVSRSHSRHSFSSDTQSLPLTPPRDVSPISQYNNGIRQKLINDDEIRMLIGQNLGNYKQSGHLRKSNQYINDDRSYYNSDMYYDAPRIQNNNNSYQSTAHWQQMSQDKSRNSRQQNDHLQSPGMELVKLIREAEQHKFTPEDLQAALVHCGPQHPIDWLLNNWSKLIETVQTLSTKYGQERKENIVGTISLIEAREALRMHKGNVWHAVTECIEQRQNKFQKIMSNGNYSREDVVTALTAHQGHLENALVELGKTQLKPFLMRIWGPPMGVDNESGNNTESVLFSERQNFGENAELQNIFNTKYIEVKNTDTRAASPMSSHSIDQQENDLNAIKINNENMFHDIENLIGNMEQNQAKQNENILKSIEQLLGQMLNKQSRPQSQISNYSINSGERINVKSPIMVTAKHSNQSSVSENVEEDVKNFMAQHIQDIVPNLVDQVERDLNDDRDTKKIDNEVPDDQEKVALLQNIDEFIKRRSEEELNVEFVDRAEGNYIMEPVKLNEVIESNEIDVKLENNSIQAEKLIEVNNVENLMITPKESLTEVEQVVFDSPQDLSFNQQTIPIPSTSQTINSNPNLNDAKLSEKSELENEIKTVESESLEVEKLSEQVQYEAIAIVDQIVYEAENVLQESVQSFPINTESNTEEVRSIPIEPKSVQTDDKQSAEIDAPGSVIDSKVTSPNTQPIVDQINKIEVKNKSFKISSLAKKKRRRSLTMRSRKIIRPKIGPIVISGKIYQPTQDTNQISTAMTSQTENMESTVTNIPAINDPEVVVSTLEIENNFVIKLTSEDNLKANEVTTKNVQIEITDVEPIPSNDSDQLQESMIKIENPFNYIDSTSDLPVESNSEENVQLKQIASENNIQILTPDNENNNSMTNQEYFDALDKSMESIFQSQNSKPRDFRSVSPNFHSSNETNDFSTSIIESNSPILRTKSITPHFSSNETVISVTERLPVEIKSIQDNNNSDEKHSTDETVGIESQSELSLRSNSAKNSTESPINDVKLEKNPQNLSDLVKDTQRLIKQMKDEINSDIASYISDEEYSEYSENESGEWSIEEEEEEGEEDEEDYEEEYEEEEDEVGEGDWSDEEYEDVEESEYYEDEEDGIVSEIDEVKNDGKFEGPTIQSAITEDDILQSVNGDNIISTETSVDVGESVLNSLSADNGHSAETKSNISENIILSQSEGSEVIENIILESVTDVSSKTEINDEHTRIEESVEEVEESVENRTEESNSLEVVSTITIDDNTGSSDLIQESPSIDDHNDTIETKTDAIITDELQENVDTPSTSNNEVTLVHPISQEVEEFKKESNNLQLNITKIEISLKRSPPVLIERTGTPENRKDVSQISNQNITLPELNDNRPSKSLKDSIEPTNNTSKDEKNINSVPQVDKKPTKSNTQSNDPKKSKILNKIPVRKSSLPGPFGSINTTNVKSLQKEFLNKTTQKPINVVNNIAKPSKLIPPKVYTKDVISSLTKKINKFIKPNQSAAKIMTQEIPKKKYHETCFSDEYQTSEDEAPISPISPVRRPPLRQQSMPNIVTEDEEEDESSDRKARRLLNENKVKNLAEGFLAVALMELKFDSNSSLWAATQCSDIDQAIELLQQECELCNNNYPLNKMVTMLRCTDSCCKNCAKSYFTTQITDRNIIDCTCPFCKMPEIVNRDISDDYTLDYFADLDILLKGILDESVHELFQRKVRDRTLMSDPNFKWCINCSSGFYARPRQKRLICPECGSVTCSQCRKPWGKQHEGISCEKFAEWQELNDPDHQAAGVAEHLRKHGISCPKCKYEYSLARGGCMHFTCIQCKFEFCYGCGKTFKMGAKCGISDHCARLGLHAHHPRNCLFYLRDKEPYELENLLKMKNVPFNQQPTDCPPVESGDGAKCIQRCPIPIQKETPSGLIDTICKNDVPENHAGLCRQHYVEYLVNAISKANIDSLPILDLTDCIQELRRRGIPLPERGPWDTNEIYREMCQKIILEQIPLE